MYAKLKFDTVNDSSEKVQKKSTIKKEEKKVARNENEYRDKRTYSQDK